MMDLVKEEGIQLAAPSVNMKSSLEPRYLPLHFIATENFNKKTVNQMMKEFYYCELGATLLKQKWADNSGQKLYLDLQDAILNQLKVCYSNLNLIQNVWTTKGNCFGFIGALVSFINNDWKFKVVKISIIFAHTFLKSEGFLSAKRELLPPQQNLTQSLSARTQSMSHNIASLGFATTIF
ncbi:hypothetical protein VP01_1266g7 [Puccinia sorghi]|uniref:Uncharacterized protein n=1 Tax=Puccinia sorghi TaxID=27349 RepID=A0A0L6VPD3_9BASI|nr:hypothetical protein VP01_1266g7 [Puccinia sorghi]